jgi:hypothetical protein
LLVSFEIIFDPVQPFSDIFKVVGVGDPNVSLREMLRLNPTFYEMDAFSESLADTYRIVTVGDGRIDYRLPFIHETWGKKWSGRTHIDMGNGKIHLMLDKKAAPEFIEFIKQYRKQHILLKH